ncbi:MAG: toll/interleukin-1 receptor domain-containing protein [Clostridia bacterium]|nr:toll/interleukin-1 receptor domain-containing protein [Clostridia bacterium]
MEQRFEFDAFISYSHRDMNWGRWLQTKLERHRIPAEARREGTFTGKHLRVFRDQTDLAGVELQESIQRELRLSRYLIVICSPNSAASPWVAAEIAYFKRIGRAENIIPFIVEGEPETDRAELECYSEELRNDPERHYLGANVGELGKQKAFLRLLSILLGVRFNRLVDRERRRTILRRSIIGGIAAVVFGVTGVLLWQNARTENERRMLMYSDVMATYAQTNKLTPEILSMLELSANAGNADACLTLGHSYEFVAPDPEKAFYWFRKGAELGDATCLTALGHCYATGIGTEADMEKAFACYDRAAEMGNSSGMNSAALCYRDGEGTAKDPEKALRLFEQAAENGDELSVTAAAYCYMQGIGTEPDAEKAFHWMQRAENGTNTTALFNLGLMYLNGIGTEKDEQKAFELFLKAATLGDADALVMVGSCIEGKVGIEDPALWCYEKALTGGSELAKDILEKRGK